MSCMEAWGDTLCLTSRMGFAGIALLAEGLSRKSNIVLQRGGGATLMLSCFVDASCFVADHDGQGHALVLKATRKAVPTDP